MLFLLRRAVPAGLPDLDRHSFVHPGDRRREPARRRAHHLRREHHGRHVRARLPDRDFVPGGLRARGGRRQAGAHRAVAALRDRRDDGDGQESCTPARRRRAERVAIVGAGPAGLSCAHALAVAGHQVDDFRTAREAGRPQRIRHRRLQDPGRLRAKGSRFHPVDRRHRGEARRRARPRRRSGVVAARL